MIIINAIMKVQSEHREQYLALVQPLIQAANAEEGSLYYEHFEKTDEPNTFVMIEHYKDQAAVEAHNASEHFKTFFGQVSELLSAKPDIVVAQPIQ